MAFIDKIKGKAAEAVDKHGDKISGGLSKAGEFADKKTKGKYSDKIAASKEKVGERLSKRNQGSDITGTPTATDAPLNPAAGVGTSSPPAPEPTVPTSTPGTEPTGSPAIPVPEPSSELASDDDTSQPPSAPTYPPAP